MKATQTAWLTIGRIFNDESAQYPTSLTLSSASLRTMPSPVNDEGTPRYLMLRVGPETMHEAIRLLATYKFFEDGDSESERNEVFLVKLAIHPEGQHFPITRTTRLDYERVRAFASELEEALDNAKITQDLARVMRAQEVGGEATTTAGAEDIATSDRQGEEVRRNDTISGRMGRGNMVAIEQPRIAAGGSFTANAPATASTPPSRAILARKAGVAISFVVSLGGDEADRLNLTPLSVSYLLGAWELEPPGLTPEGRPVSLTAQVEQEETLAIFGVLLERGFAERADSDPPTGQPLGSVTVSVSWYEEGRIQQWWAVYEPRDNPLGLLEAVEGVLDREPARPLRLVQQSLERIPAVRRGGAAASDAPEDRRRVRRRGSNYGPSSSRGDDGRAEDDAAAEHRPPVWIGLTSRGARRLLRNHDIDVRDLDALLLREYRRAPVPPAEVGAAVLDAEGDMLLIRLLPRPTDDGEGSRPLFTLIVDPATGHLRRRIDGKRWVVGAE